jgi:hypothetical protein
LSQIFDGGLDVDAMSRFVNETPVDDERSLKLEVVFRGKEITLEFSVFMDDVDAPDIHFFSDSKAVTSEISAEMAKYAEELGQ